MEFKQEMPTTPFISLIYRKHAQYLNNKVKVVELTFGLYPFLIEIYKNNGISQEELAKSLYLNESTVTRNLSKLEKKGLIIKTPQKRKKIITITEEGSIIAKKIMDYDEEWDNLIKKDLTNNEYEDFKKTLIKISEGLI